jgi:hypothetical protein
MKTTTTKVRIDYTQLAAQLNYAALEEKLDQLRVMPPPKRRKKIADVLAPFEGRLRLLHAKGWTYDQLAKELNDFGLPVKPASLRDCIITRKSKSPVRKCKSNTGIIKT